MPDDETDQVDPPCCDPDCGSTGAFWLYRPDRDAWEPRCRRHVVHLHPSLELHAWLASGYGRTVERGRPSGRPGEPSGGRAAAFRAAIDETMG